MIGKDGTERRWSIGELARATGLTVRTLHYYDEIGLVSASERTGSGHRRYTEADLRRLYRVRALRQLGLSLDEIKTVLERPPTDDLTTLRDLLAAQLAELEIHAQRTMQLRRQIGELLERLDGSVMPDPDQFMTSLEMMSMFETYFTPEQREYLARRRAELGEDAIEATKAEWLGIVQEIRRHQLDGTPVDDPRVQALTLRWDEIGTAFQGGDERIDEQVRAAANTMWQDNRAELSAQLSRQVGWPAPDDMADVVDYVQRARQARPA